MNMTFIQLQHRPSLYHMADRLFREKIEPIYGDQSSALAKIAAGTDRRCEFLLVRDVPIGMLVYKTSLQHEYQLEHAFELKTAMIFDAYRNQGIGKYLFKRAEEIALSYHAKKIYATVSNNMTGMLQYLYHLGWYEIHTTKSTDNLINVTVLAKKLVGSGDASPVLSCYDDHQIVMK